ncbi:ankyrin repeat domain-containing protein [Roseateles sp. YR242]|uniref:ankyrin repeat domain-containing protein n=1 Tax=Roseateles sp. YR242 TaxID=1855305 RepID=UPI002100FE12|nr:ankyrin repeat domain-containing protein [Roseateles sp. YR242]
MSIKLSVEDVEALQGSYSSLINYQSDDPLSPIDPASYVDSNGDSLLHIAVQEGDLDSVEIMIRAGFDVNSLGDMDNTPLHYAYDIKNSQLIEMLKAAGAKGDVRNAFGKVPG